MGTVSPRFIFLFIISFFLHGIVFAQFPQIAVHDLDGEKLAYPAHERQIIFVGSSVKVQSDLRRWNRELHKTPRLIEGTALRGIAILPEWMGNPLTRSLALMYVRSQLPQQFHNSVYVFFADQEKARQLFELPSGTDDDLHLFYLNNTGNILVYTYGAPSYQKINMMATFSKPRTTREY